MALRALAAVFLAFVCASVVCQLAAPTAISDFGYTSCSRDSCLFVPDDQHPHTYRHGDFSYSVSEDGKLALNKGQRPLLSTVLKNLSASVFVAWDRSSNWFAVTWSDGGAIGNFHTRVFHIDGDQAHEMPSVTLAFTDFRTRHWCKTRGDNVQAYGWDEKTHGLILVASVYPTGDCGKDLGHTEAYLVRPTDGAILRHMNLREFNVYAKSHPQ